MVHLNPITPSPSPDDVRLTRLEHDIGETGHRCSQCVGPYGRSAIPCPNDRERIEQERLVRVGLWRDRLAGKDES